MKTTPAGVLEGVRVLDLSSVIMGPFAAQMLGDMGADVIKIEPPEGDIVRPVGARRSERMGALYLNLNRNKRGMVLDLKRADARPVLARLIASVDIVLHSNRASARDRLGLDHASLAAGNPALISCHLTGFAEPGPYAGRPALDDIIQALSGFAMLQTAVAGEPRYIPSVVADKICGVYAAYAIAMAFIHRLRTGRGQEVSLPMLETMVSFVTAEHLDGYVFEPPLAPMGYGSIRAATRRPYRTRDGYLAFLPYTDAHWIAFAEIVGKPEMMKDPRFASFGERARNFEVTFSAVADEMLMKTNAEWLALLERRDIPFAVVNDLEDLATDPHLEATGFWKLMTHPTEGQLRTAAIPFELSESPGNIRRLAPGLGQHTAEVLTEHGFSKIEVETLTAQGGVCAC